MTCEQLYICQKAAIDSQIASLQEASDALETALEVEHLQDATIDNDAISTVIRAVMFPQDDWRRNAFTDEAWAGIVTRRMQYTEADFQQFAEDWQRLIEQFEEIQHLPVDSEPVQALAETMDAYITSFSAGDREAEQGVAKVWQNREHMPKDYQMGNPELTRFMNQAMTIYRQRRDA